MNGEYAMTQKKCTGRKINLQEIFGVEKDSFKELLREVLQEVLEQEMTEAIGAEKGERRPERLGYRSGYYSRSLVTKVGKLELRIPQDRQGHFSTQLFERYQRSEKALVSALAEMYVQGVSTRKVKAITEELWGHAFSAATISAPDLGRESGKVCQAALGGGLSLPDTGRSL
jgi:transposase-like protein